MLSQAAEQASSYVSMAIKAGHFYDPDACQGLAHLLEHMLFMGSRHLPKPNSMNDLVERCGGSINAWTGTEYANFHFSCQSEALPNLIPAFADMLRAPLLDKNALEKEIHAIDAEFQFKRKDDLRRLYQIHKETCNPAHPFAKFSVGNAALFNRHSLTELHYLLQQFHQHYYCAANMCLCIISPMPAQMLRQNIEQSFGPMNRGHLAHSDWPAMYTSEQLAVQINIRPLQAARRMIVTFALPGLHNEFKTKPLNYISHLLGDEGEGSLLASLKARGLVLNLIAGSGIEGDDFKDFNVSFQLTPLGLENQETILLALYRYIELVRESFSDPWRYEEKAQLTTLALQYEENPKPLNVACDYAQYLFQYALEDIPKLRSTIGNFDRACLEHALSYFRTDNMRIKVIAPDIPTDRVCHYYDAEYRITPLDNALKSRLAAPPVFDDMFLPPANPYLGDEYHLVLPERDYAVPKRIVDKTHQQVWFAQDQQFHTPKGDIYLSFDAPAFARNIQSVAAKRVWMAALNDHLQAKYYRAEIAGLHYRIYGHQAGFTLHCRGFTNQQMLLAEQLLQTIHAYEADEETFAHMRQLQIQNLQNSLLNKPTNRLFSRLSVLIQRNTQAPIELLEAMQDCEFDCMKQTRDAALSSYFVDGFIHGNWTSEEALNFTTRLSAICVNANNKPMSRSVTQLPVGQALFHQVDCEHDDAAVVLYLQAPSCSLQDTAMCMVLEQMLSAPFFNALRTEKQLGYVVGTGYVPHNQHPGMSFYIQSPQYSPKVLLDAMTEFLFQQLDEIDFYRFYWNTIKNNLLKQLEERDMSLSMKSQRLWVSLGMQDFAFNRNSQLAACISQLDFEDIKNYAEKIGHRQSFGELILYAAGCFDAIETPPERTLTNIAEFKRTSQYFS